MRQKEVTFGPVIFFFMHHYHETLYDDKWCSVNIGHILFSVNNIYLLSFFLGISVQRLKCRKAVLRSPCLALLP